MDVVIGLLYDSEQTHKVIEALKAQGIDRDHLSFLTAHEANELDDLLNEEPEESALKGAIAGGSIGSILGLLGGVALLPIPGIGPLIGSGLITSAAGGALGTFLGSIYSVRADEKSEIDIKEELAEGAILIVAKTDHAHNEQVKKTLEAAGAEHVEIHEDVQLDS